MGARRQHIDVPVKLEELARLLDPDFAAFDVEEERERARKVVLLLFRLNQAQSLVELCENEIMLIEFV